MKLSTLKETFDLEIIQDVEFDSLGYISHNNPNQLIYIEDTHYLPVLLTKSNIAAIITSEDIVTSIPGKYGRAISGDPKKTFYHIHNYLVKETNFYWRPFQTEIATSAMIHPTASIANNNVKIGEGCKIGPNVSILEGTIIEDEVIIRAGCVIGTEGFQFIRFSDGILAISHGGGVLIHDNVEFQANCCVSKAVFNGFTEIGEESKFDNLIHVAHNVTIGKRCLFAACVMIAGSARIGDDVWLGPSASISSEVEVGDGASITLGSVVTQDVPPGKRVTGNFAIEHEKFMAFLKSIR